MSPLRVLISRVEEDEDDGPMTDLTSVDLPDLQANPRAAPRDTLEAVVARVGQHVLGRLAEWQWAECAAPAVAR